MGAEVCSLENLEGLSVSVFSDSYRNKRVLVTGHTGFKGSWLVTWLLKMGAEVIGFSNDDRTTPSHFEALKLEQKITHICGDVADTNAVQQCVETHRPDVIFHLAAQAIVSTSYSHPVDTIKTNVMGTTSVLEALRHVQHPCVAIIITSDKCYDNVEWVWGYKESDPMGGKDIYSGSKGAAELIFKSYYHSFFKNSDHIKIASARAGNVIGGGDWAKDRIVPDCVRSWSKMEVVTIRSPKSTRPWQHVLEPLSGYLALGVTLLKEDKLSGESYNFGPASEQNCHVEKLLRDLSAHWDFTDQNEAYQAVENKNFHEAGLLKLNCDKALYDLSWLPTLSYEDVVSLTSKWYYSFYKNEVDAFQLTTSQIAIYESLATSKGRVWAEASS